MIIRRATQDDFPAIQKLRIQLFDLLAEWMPDTFRSVPYPDGLLAQVLEDERQDLFVAVIDERVVGYALVRDETVDTQTDPALLPMRYTYLLDFCVDASYRGRGIGRRLFDQVCVYAREHQAACIELSVAAANTRSIDLYKRLGFTETIHRMRCPLDS